MRVPIRSANKISRELHILRRKWGGLLILQSLLVATGTMMILNWWQSQAAYEWLILAGVSSALYFWYLWRRLGLNHPQGEVKVLSNFGPGNLMTIGRGMLLMLLVGFLFSPWPPGWLVFIPGMLYISAALADLFDGYLARLSRHQTRLGEELDLSLDGFGLLVASVMLVQYGQVPAWYLLVGMARYLFVGGIWLRNRMGKPVYPLAEIPVRRPFAGAQMGFAAIVLFPFFSPPGTYLAAAIFAAPFLISFLLDWFTVSGFRFNHIVKEENLPASALDLVTSTGKVAKRIRLQKLVPLVLRTVLVILLFSWLVNNTHSLVSTLGNVTITPVDTILLAVNWESLIFLMIFTGLILIAAGVAGRIGALSVLFGLGIYLEFFQMGTIEIILVLISICLVYLGTGPYSLWNPERKLISQRLGEL